MLVRSRRRTNGELLRAESPVAVSPTAMAPNPRCRRSAHPAAAAGQRRKLAGARRRPRQAESTPPHVALVQVRRRFSARCHSPPQRFARSTGTSWRRERRGRSARRPPTEHSSAGSPQLPPRRTAGEASRVDGERRVETGGRLAEPSAEQSAAAAAARGLMRTRRGRAARDRRAACSPRPKRARAGRRVDGTPPRGGGSARRPRVANPSCSAANSRFLGPVGKEMRERRSRRSSASPRARGGGRREPASDGRWCRARRAAGGAGGGGGASLGSSSSTRRSRRGRATPPLGRSRPTRL